VRGCAEPLLREARSARCAGGHSFDRARSGYWNLLQPQDRRSPTPGDSRAAAQARRRLHDAGHTAPLIAELRRQLDGLDLPPTPALLDVGCGEGSLLAALAAGRALEAQGLDLSTAAIDMAARRFPAATWVVANADRSLPYASGGADIALVVSARLNPSELARVLAPGGRLLVVTPAPDDLVELRAAVLGEGTERGRLDRALALLAPAFDVEARSTVRHVADLDAPSVLDALAATYRGARRSQRERVDALGALRVTMSYDVARLRLRAVAPR
jgi:23S rRNA (guanine745-N1)-methyltransferase